VGLQNGLDGSKHFHDVILLYMQDGAQELGVTKPEAVSRAVLKAKERYPEKRIIVHYVQPHDPYIGEQKIPIFEGDVDDPYEYFIRNDIKKAYNSNLRRVLGSVGEMILYLEGEIV